MLNLEIPLNNLSFGQTSVSILRELYNRGMEFPIIPITTSKNIDISAQPNDERFNTRLKAGLAAQNTYCDKTLKLWHINGSVNALGRDQVLLTFHETDELTKTEIDILKRSNTVVVTSEFTQKLMLEAGINAYYHPLGFDSFNFRKTEKKYYDDDRIVFMILGKLEHRKRTVKAIRSWIKKFGNNKKYFLHVGAHNQFMSPEDMKAAYHEALGGQVVFNIQFYDWMPTNAAYNDFLNAGHIVLGMSGSEAFGLPEFHATALGKHAVVHNVNGYRSWANDQNSILVNPSGKIPAYDGKFFQKGQLFNQGNFFDWSEDMFVAACEEALRKYQSNPVNTAGLELQKTHTVKNFVDFLMTATNNI